MRFLLYMATAKHRAIDRLAAEIRHRHLLLAKLGRSDEARAEFERAASLTQNARERNLLLEHAAACARQTT